MGSPWPGAARAWPGSMPRAPCSMASRLAHASGRLFAPSPPTCTARQRAPVSARHGAGTLLPAPYSRPRECQHEARAENGTAGLPVSLLMMPKAMPEPCPCTAFVSGEADGSACLRRPCAMRPGQGRSFTRGRGRAHSHLPPQATSRTKDWPSSTMPLISLSGMQRIRQGGQPAEPRAGDAPPSPRPAESRI